MVGGAVSVADRGGVVYALAADSGRVARTFDTGRTRPDDRVGPVTGSPTVADGWVYTGGPAGAVYGLDADTGDARWVFDTEGLNRDPSVRCSSAVADGRLFADGWVFVGA